MSKSNTKDNHIAILKKGALLVRLNTNKHLINYYVNSLELEKANNEFEKQKKENKNIIKGFQQEWSFCPVYFFYSNHYLDIKQNQFENSFKDINQTPLNNSEKENLKDNFLIAYFGENPGSVSFDALVLTTKELKQLHKPTPRYVRTYNGLWFIKRKLKKTIRILQNKIHAYCLRKK